MAFELYYTSAPEGLKRGASGFCTVAATDGIPRVLGERLESLSAYRHHFAAGTGENPISFAHSLVNVSGTAYHVLSRICDAGVDHTQRTNAFAHHLVVGAREMAGAGGGPAWLLRQTGVMTEQWDGHVGTLPPRTLPMGGGGTGGAGGVCRLWKEATGDPGWAGRLADSFVATTAGTPVCILFPPGQDMLPLLAEAIALLPPELRWSVTFNTYFTTMPTSATCLWRCCLAGTPAAQSGTRYAAGGLILDLTAANLGPAPTSPYVEYARTGRGRPIAANTPTAKRAVGVTTTRPAAAPGGTYELAERPEDADALAEDPAEPATPLPPSDRRRRKPVQVDVLEEITGRATASAHARRRRQVLWLFAGALIAIAAGMTIVWLTARNLAPPPMDNADDQAAATRATHQPTVNLPPVPSPIGTPDTQAGISPPIAAQVVTPPKPAPPLNDGPLVALPGDLNAPAAGTGMHNPEQSWDLPPLSAKGGKEGITVMLLGGTPLVATGAAGTLETDPPTGPGSESPPPAAATPEVRIRWQDKDAPTGTAWTAATLDLANNKLNLTWNAGFMLTHPDAIATVYWRLRAGTILRRGTDSNAARYEFRPWQSADIDFLQDAPAINAPIPFPEDATVSAINLPPGWQQESSGQSTGGTSTRPALAATQIIILRKPGEDATATPEFELLFRQGLTEVASTYAQKRQAADQSLADAQDELAAATQASTQPTSATANAGQTPQEAQSRIVPLTAQIARYKQAVAGYNELERFNAVVMLGGTRVGTIHFVRNPAATAPSSQPTTR